VIAAVVFDLDGVIVDSEQVWEEVREAYTLEHGRVYTERATRDMMGMSSTEWSRYMAEVLGLPGTLPVMNRKAVEYSIKAGLAASTVTPGITAPDESLTTPAMLPVSACAHAAVGRSNTHHTRSPAILWAFIVASLRNPA